MALVSDAWTVDVMKFKIGVALQHEAERHDASDMNVLDMCDTPTTVRSNVTAAAVSLVCVPRTRHSMTRTTATGIGSGHVDDGSSPRAHDVCWCSCAALTRRRNGQPMLGLSNDGLGNDVGMGVDIRTAACAVADQHSTMRVSALVNTKTLQKEHTTTKEETSKEMHTTTQHRSMARSHSSRRTMRHMCMIPSSLATALLLVGRLR